MKRRLLDGQVSRPRTGQALILLCAFVAISSSCMNTIGRDDTLEDEFAQFKATGGQCSAGPNTPVDDVTDLSNATQYRWIGYGGVLQGVVSDRGRVYYDDLNNDLELLEQSRRTVSHLSTLDATNLVGHDEKMAFWLNAYNAFVLFAAANEYAADNEFRVDTNSFEFFSRQEHNVGGHIYSLNQIEHGVMRGTDQHPSTAFLPEEEQAFLFALHDDLWAGSTFEPRFHFVLNCASSSCPSLIKREFRGATLDEDLDVLTAEFLNDEVRGAGPDGISLLFDFYFSDFEDIGGAGGFIAGFRSVDDVNLLRFLPYDWALNLEPPP